MENNDIFQTRRSVDLFDKDKNLDDDLLKQIINTAVLAPSALNLAPMVKYLAALDNIYFVLEHTPRMGYSWDYVMESTKYIRSLVYD